MTLNLKLSSLWKQTSPSFSYISLGPCKPLQMNHTLDTEIGRETKGSKNSKNNICDMDLKMIWKAFNIGIKMTSSCWKIYFIYNDRCNVKNKCRSLQLKLKYQWKLQIYKFKLKDCLFNFMCTIYVNSTRYIQIRFK